MDNENKMVLVEVSELGRIVRDAVRMEIKSLITQNPASESNSPGYYSRKELLKVLKISTVTLWRLESSGRIKAKQVGRRKLYDMKEVLQLVNSGKLSKYVRV